MSKLEFYHFDTLNGVYTNADPFDTTFTLSNPMTNISKIFIKSTSTSF